MSTAVGHESHDLLRKPSRNVFQTEEHEENIRRRAKETTKVFSGERVSWFSFFFMFRDIIFISKGSVITAIWIELLITLAISFYAVWMRTRVMIADEKESDDCTGMWCFPADPIGHQIVGTLLAFLVVFRSQIAFNMYLDGRTQFQRYMSASTELCMEILGCLAHQANELHAADGPIDAIMSKVDAHKRSMRAGDAAQGMQREYSANDAALDNAAAAEWISAAVGADAAAKIHAKMVELNVDTGLLLMLDQQGWKELGVESGVLRAKLVRAAGAQPKMSLASRRKKNIELAFFSQEIVRLTKLCFFCVIEHTRSTCGDPQNSWKDAHDMVDIFALDAEEKEFNRLFGRPENHLGQKQQVVVNGHDDEGQPREIGGPSMQELPSSQSRREPSFSWIPRTRPGGAVNPSSDTGKAPSFHDPTRSKPLMVLMWMQILIERLTSRQCLQPQKLGSVSRKMDALVDSFHCIDKVNTMVLPFPYCQLLKLFLLFFCFTLPLVLSERLGMWTPFVCALASMGFFGLDQVGAELEQPFGTDTNDFPLLAFGKGLCNDLDNIVRTLERTVYKNRISLDDEHITNASEALDNLAWYHVVVDDDEGR